MKKSLIVAMLSVLLSVNVLTPMSYAVENVGELSGIAENGGENAENGANGSSGTEGEGSYVGNTQDSSVTPQNDDNMSSGTEGEGFYVGNTQDSSAEPQNDDNTSSGTEGEGSYEGQTGNQLDSSAEPQKDGQDEQTSQNDGQDEQVPQNDGQDEPALVDPEDPIVLPLAQPMPAMAPLMAPAPSQANSTTGKDLHLYFVNGSDTKHYTIMDRNIGATEVGDEGYYYQWGNNYGFTPGTFTTTNVKIPYEEWKDGIPGGYYYDHAFITKGYSSVDGRTNNNWQEGTSDQRLNSNLWGGADDTLASTGAGTKVDRKGPCPDGYYVPSAYDHQSLKNIRQDSTTIPKSHTQFAKDLLIPIAGSLEMSDGSRANNSSDGYLWTSSPTGVNNAYRVNITSNQFSDIGKAIGGGLGRASGNPVRCFKNDFSPAGTTGLLTIELNGGEKTVIAVDADGHIYTLNDPEHPDGKEFKGRYTTPNFIKWTKVEKDDNLNGATDLYARWEGQEESFVVKIESSDTNSGTVSTGSIIVVSGTVLGTLSGNPITIDGKNITATESADTDQYDFSFVGWTNNCGTTVTTGCTITANFKSEVKNHTVTVVSNNTNYGTVSTGTITVPYGTNIDTGSSVLKIGTGTSTATESTDTDQYDFSFVGWTNNCGATVTTGCTITANFKSEVKKYEITWKNGDGNTLKTEQVEYGTTPSYTGTTPTKTATAQYTYTWNNAWSPVIESVTTGATYTAQFDSTVNEYLITFVDGDGKTIQTGMVAYGDTPSYTGATPTKTATAQYTYTWNNAWSPVIESVTTGATYTAQFDSTVNEYLITFVDGDGKTIQTGMVAYGDTPNYTGTTPTKTATAQYTYTFNGAWSPAIVSVTEAATYTAQFSGTVNQYTIIFVDEDGTELLSGTLYDYGTPANSITKPADPTKAETSEFKYTFAGWSPALADVKGDVTYTATYTSQKKGGNRSGGGKGGNSDSNTHGSADEPDSSTTSQNDSSSLSGTDMNDLNGEAQELFDVHKWAYENGLTRYANINDARMNDPINRAEMAKISSIFDINFLGKTPDESKEYECSQYSDISIPDLGEELRYFVVQSCELGNMGYSYDNMNYISDFMPYDPLNVAQASVILSRMAWGKRYIIGPEMWYQGHMYAVYDKALLDDTSDPWRHITRREAFTAFYRLDKLLKEKK